MPIKPCYVTAYTLASALGLGSEATLESLRSKRGGLVPHALSPSGVTWFGHAHERSHITLPDTLSLYDNACSRLIVNALAQDRFMESVENAKARFGKHRIACFLGTITGGLCEVEDAYQDMPNQWENPNRIPLEYHGSISSPVQLSRKILDITGPYAVISTACSSSAKVFATAHRYLQAGICDAAVVAGVEPLCESLVYGFRSLGVLSNEPCKPFDQTRNGISIGSAAGFALLMNEPVEPNNFRLVGYGESTDAYHMTSPHPDGAGIELSMRLALASANLSGNDIDYVNAHGSATPFNDEIEDAAIARVLGNDALVSSTKGWTGHTQGAAGITEAIILLLSMKEGMAPANLNCLGLDPALRCRIPLDNLRTNIRFGMSNSMGFGGNNATLIFGAPL